MDYEKELKSLDTENKQLKKVLNYIANLEIIEDEDIAISDLKNLKSLAKVTLSTIKNYNQKVNQE